MVLTIAAAGGTEAVLAQNEYECEIRTPSAGRCPHVVGAGTGAWELDGFGPAKPDIQVPGPS
jgi:hypothetical protein